jgi:VCBS repeat-containing protein
LNQLDATVQALRNAQDTLTDTIQYTVVDSAGQTKTANLVVTIVGKNDMPEFTGVSTISVSNTATNSSGPHDLLFKDPDTGESKFNLPAHTLGAYGNFEFNQSANTWSYKVDGARAGGLTAGFRAYDVLTIESFDGSVTQTMQVEVKPTGAMTGTPQIFNLLNTDRVTLAGDTLSTEIDTLVLGGSNMSLDLTAATTKITHIEQVDLGADSTGGQTPNVLTLNLASLLQSDTHTLTVFGGAADTVNFGGAIQTSHTAVTVNGLAFTDYHYTTTVNSQTVELDLLVQQGIVLGSIS